MPVDLKKLRKAKLIVVGKNIMIPVILGQLSAILMRGAYYGWHVKSWLDLGLYTPVMVGIGFLIFKEAEHRWLCFKAVKIKPANKKIISNLCFRCKSAILLI